MSKIKIVFEDNDESGGVKIYAEGLDSSITREDIKNSVETASYAETMAINVIHNIMKFTEVLSAVDDKIADFDEDTEFTEEEKKYFN